MYPCSKWHVYQSSKSRIKWTVAQPLNQRLCKRQIDDCTSVESTFVQASNRRLYKRWIDGCISVDSTVAQTLIQRLQALNRRLYKRQNQRLDQRRIEGYIDYFKKSIKIFRCSFSATVNASRKFIWLIIN